MKPALYAASLVLVAGTVLGCGSSDGSDGGSDAASDSSSPAATITEAKFCEDFTTLTTDMGTVSDGEDTSAMITKVKDATAEMGDAGTPEGMPTDAREGFELFVDTISSIDEGSTMAELQEVGGDLSADDEKKFTAFTTYLAGTCQAS